MPGWRDVRAVAEAADQNGLDSVWLADHFLYRDPDGRIYGMHEAWTLLSAVAASTTRVELGTMVLCASFRDPGLTAKMAATLDEVSGGRLILGVGAAGTTRSTRRSGCRPITGSAGSRSGSRSWPG